MPVKVVYNAMSSQNTKTKWKLKQKPQKCTKKSLESFSGNSNFHISSRLIYVCFNIALLNGKNIYYYQNDKKFVKICAVKKKKGKTPGS